MSDVKIVDAANASNPVIGDLCLENGTARLTRTLSEEVAQDLQLALSLFLGEWFLDPEQGMPYWQSILGHKIPLRELAQLYTSAILSRPGVASLSAPVTAARLPSRRVALAFSVTLTDGSTLVYKRFTPGVA